MAEYTLKRLLGGIANGYDVPDDWDLISEWVEPGTGNKSVYDKRAFFMGDDKFIVWVAVDVPEVAFQGVMRWHREMYRGDLVDAQKDVLRESIAAATNYTSVIMVVGYAALFTLWSQMSGTGVGKFTPMTSFTLAILLALSVLAFIGWEVFGMIVRSKVNIALARAVDDAPRFEAHIREHREKMARLMRGLQPAWAAVVGVAAGCAVLAFLVMLSAIVHAAWLAACHP